MQVPKYQQCKMSFSKWKMPTKNLHYSERHVRCPEQKKDSKLKQKISDLYQLLKVQVCKILKRSQNELMEYEEAAVLTLCQRCLGIALQISTEGSTVTSQPQPVLSHCITFYI